eukprot:7275708-Ditylum_brightwellii.AAC.1
MIAKSFFILLATVLFIADAQPIPANTVFSSTFPTRRPTGSPTGRPTGSPKGSKSTSAPKSSKGS